MFCYLQHQQQIVNSTGFFWAVVLLRSQFFEMSYYSCQVLNAPLLWNIPRNCFIVSEILSKRNLRAYVLQYAGQMFFGKVWIKYIFTLWLATVGLMSRLLLVLSVPRLLVLNFPSGNFIPQKGRHCSVLAICFGMWQLKYFPVLSTEICKINLILTCQQLYFFFSVFRAQTCIYKPGKSPEGGESCPDRKCHPHVWGGTGHNWSEVVQGWKTARVLSEIQNRNLGQIPAPGGGAAGEEGCWGIHLWGCRPEDDLQTGSNGWVLTLW